MQYLELLSGPHQGNAHVHNILQKAKGDYVRAQQVQPDKHPMLVSFSQASSTSQQQAHNNHALEQTSALHIS